MRSVKWILATSASLIVWLPGQAALAQQAGPPTVAVMPSMLTASQDTTATGSNTDRSTPAASSARSTAAQALEPVVKSATESASRLVSQATGVSSDQPAPQATASMDSASSKAPFPATTVTQTADASNPMGTAVSPEALDTYRGGSQTFNDMQVNGTLSDTRALGVATGSNTITDGSFANSSGLPTVIQNSGANVLIQNATIVNVQFKQ